MSKVQYISVGAGDDGQRLDRWMQKVFPGTPYSLIQKLVRKGQVRVEGKRVETSHRLEHGQNVRIPPILTKDKSDIWFRPMEGDEKFVKSMIIYDDGDIIAVNKPCGIASQGGLRVTRHMDALMEHLTDSQERKPKLVHRLDRDTSGILLFARERETASRLGKMFMSKDIQKTYIAITIPAPLQEEGEISIPLAKGEGLQKDMMVASKDGKHAITDFEVIERAGKMAALTAFYPRTGRTHQIRVHAAEAEFPILGDEKYFPHDYELPDFERNDRLHLHAIKIVFSHPDKNKGTIELFAPIPDDFKKAMKSLGFQNINKL